jgi:uncharacterized membrane protein
LNLYRIRDLLLCYFIKEKKMQKMMKTITWNSIAFSITFIIGWIITGSIETGGIIGIVCRVLKIPSYWIHESIWDKIHNRRLRT